MPFAYFFLILLFSVIYWLGDFPGGFNLDAYGQWLQAHGMMQYNDWHPVISTLLIQLILSIHDSFAFYIAVQIIAFSAAAAYLLCCIQKQGVDSGILLGVALYIGLNPAVGLNTICMTKDAQFTILVTILTGSLIRIVATDGEWLHRNVHLMGISVLSLLVLLIRHNGLLFIVPAFFLLLLYKAPRIKIMASFALVFMMFGLVKGPIFLPPTHPGRNDTG